MTVNIVIAESLDGAQISDTLQGGGTGLDLGQVGTASWTPVVSKTANTGHQDLYIQHDGALPIFGLALFIQQMSVGTGHPYGGGDSAADDYAAMIAMGNTSGSSKNNADGLSSGLWVDMDWNASDATRFDQANFPSLVKIFGDNNTDGISISSAFLVAAEAMVYNNGGTEDSPSGPVAGKVGASVAPTVFGDAAHVKLRQYLEQNFGQNGYFQFELVAAYSYEG